MTSRFPDRTPEIAPVPQTTPPVTPPTPAPVPMRAWRLWVPLLLQSALILFVPAQDAYTAAVGKPVTLQTAPVDPYDPLRGYFQTLGYDISQADNLKDLPGGEWFSQNGKGNVYIVLQAPDQPSTNPPTPWQPVRISGDRPANLPANQIAIKGRYEGWRILYGLETYYMPEDQRNEVNSAIGEVQAEDPDAFVVDVKIDPQGNAVPVGLWVRDRNFQF